MVGEYCGSNAITCVLLRARQRETRDTGAKAACGGDRGSDVATSQGLPAATKGWKRPTRDSPLEPLEVTCPRRLPDFSDTDFRLLASELLQNEYCMKLPSLWRFVSAAQEMDTVCVLHAMLGADTKEVRCCSSEIQISSGYLYFTWQPS